MCSVCKRDVPFEFQSDYEGITYGLCDTCCSVALLFMVSPTAEAVIQIALGDTFALEERAARDEAYNLLFNKAKETMDFMEAL